MGGKRFLVIPVIGMPNSLLRDGAFIFMMRIVLQLIAKGNYCYVVVPQEADTSPWSKVEGLFFVPSALPVKVFDTQRTTIDTVTLGENFSYQYGRYVVDAAIVMTGQQALMVKQTLASEVGEDVMPVFCVEQGVSWFDSDPGYVGGGINDSLHMLGSSYSHMVWVSQRDKRMFMEKAKSHGLAASRLVALEKNGYVASVPIDLPALKKHKPKKSQTLSTALFAARANSTKHPEIIVAIFDELYKQGEPIQVEFMTQTNELIGEIYTNRNQIWEGREYIKKRYGCGVDDFYAQAAKSHIYMCWSDSESYNVSVGEAALLGCVFICHDTKPHRELLGDVLTDDRFWAVDYQDAVEKVRWVIHNYEEAYALQKALRDKYEADSLTRNPADHINTKTDELMDQFVTSKMYRCVGLESVVQDMLPALEFPLTLHSLLALFEKNCYAFLTSNLRRAISRRMPVNWQIHGYVRRVLGWRDTCKNRHPIYFKE